MASSLPMKLKISILLFFLWLAPTMPSAIAATTSGGPSPPSPVKCIHHHATLTACARYLKKDDVVQVPQPSETCCRQYGEIFRSGTPTCLCRYLHPEKLKTSFSVTKLMSLHDVCQSSGATSTVPLYDLCVGLQDPQEKFDGILEVVNKDIEANLRNRNNPSMEA